MRLLALSDLHVGHAGNREAVAAIPPHPDDWLLLAGDVGDTPAQLDAALRHLVPRFAHVVWTPGNHELWTPPSLPVARRGVSHYERLVALCRTYGVDTPEDPFPIFPGAGGPVVVAPVFTLYDYSFRPPHVPVSEAVAWAAAAGVRSADEHLLAPDPYPSREAWCAARVAFSEDRLSDVPPGYRIVLLTHFPLVRAQAVLPRVPRFEVWCGTARTADWTARFPIDVVVFGHLHRRGTRWHDGVRHEEVSLGYPGQWDTSRGAAAYLRPILPSA